jgi:hypothetical protein
MLNKETQLIDDLKDFLLCNSSYKKKEIYSINNLLHHYVNVRKNFSEKHIYKQIESYVYNDQKFLKNSLFKVKNKYAFTNYIKDQQIIKRHPWLIRSVISRLKVFKRQKKIRKNNEKDNYFLDILNDKGLLIIPDFLSSSLYQNVLSEIEDIPFALNKNDSSTIKYSERVFQFLNFYPSRMKFSAQVLNQISEMVYKFGFNNSFCDCQRLISLSGFWQKINIINGNEDIQKDAHMDTFFPSLKFWYFPFDVSINKSFMYAKGSHKMTGKRMIIEAKKINQMLNVYKPESLTKRVSLNNPYGSSSLHSAIQGSLRFNETDLEYINCKLLPVTSTKNCLVIADVSGIHSRGCGEKDIDLALRIGVHGNTRHLDVF